MTQIRYAWFIKQDSSNEISRELITPKLYSDTDMRGRLFCIECENPVSRSPRLGDADAWKRRAFFRHSKSGDSFDCGLTALKVSEGAEKESTGVTTVNFKGYRAQDAPPVDYPRAIGVVGKEGGREPQSIAEGRNSRYRANDVVTSMFSICNGLEGNLDRLFIFPGQEPRKLIDSLKFFSNGDYSVQKKSIYLGKISKVQPPSHKRINVKFEGYSQGLYIDSSEADYAEMLSNVGSYLVCFTKPVDEIYRVSKRQEYCILPRKYESLMEELQKVTK